MFIVLCPLFAQTVDYYKFTAQTVLNRILRQDNPTNIPALSDIQADSYMAVYNHADWRTQAA